MKLLNSRNVFFFTLAILVFLGGGVASYFLHGSIDKQVQEVRHVVKDTTQNWAVLHKAYDTPAGFKNYTDFRDPGYLLMAAYFTDSKNRPGARLLRLSDGKVLKEWYPDLDGFLADSMDKVKKGKMINHARVQAPILMDDGGLVFNMGP